MLRPLFLEIKQRLKSAAPLIQVLLGPRQVGKTTGVLELMKAFPNAHYLSADEDLSLSADWIQTEWNKALVDQPNRVFIIDEIQNIPNWSRSIKGLWDKAKRNGKTPKLLLLGSSSLSIEEGLNESLAGRYEVVSAPHWSWLETQQITKQSLEDYLSFGGYPGAYEYTNNFDRWRDYVQKSIINNVLLKDILRIKTIKKPALLKQCFDLACSYPSQIVSYKKLLGQMQEGGNVEIVKNYLSILESAFLIKCLEKYSGSKIMEKASSPKIIPLAPALITVQQGQYNKQNDAARGFRFEACVGSELLKLSGDLFYWRDENQNEVDFIWKNMGAVWAIEVKTSENKTSRGLGAFLKKYPKAKAITIDQINFNSFVKNPVGFFARSQG